MASQEVPHRGQQQMTMRNGFLTAITPAVAGRIAALLEHPAVVQLELRAIGGAIADVPADATAFGHREAGYFLSAWGRPGPVSGLDQPWASIADDITGAYGAYASDVRPERRAETYPGAVLTRLERIASTYDPRGVFAPGRDR